MDATRTPEQVAEDKPEDTASCPVRGEFFGLDMGACGEPATHRAAFTCPNGHDRQRDICQFHADCLTDGPAEGNVCAVCSDEGRDALVTLASLTRLAEETP